MTPSAPRVLLYVQHLLGIGHFVRAVRLADGLAAAGFSVTVVSGGAPVPHIAPVRARLVQLPPVRTADVAFSGLVDLAGRPVDDAWKRRRTAALLDLAAQSEPDVVILEHFPFGRRQMRFELDPLIDDLRGKALIATSVRDVLVPPRADRIAEIIARLKRDIDLVLVHGDAGIVPFDASFPTTEIVHRLRYTGYLGPPPPAPADRGDEILVSAGGGAVAAPLIDAAIEASGISAHGIGGGATTWRIRVAATTSNADLAHLQARAPDIVIERASGDFLDRLAACRVSVSQGGYNTLVETLITGTPAVCVPFAEARETEQTTRAAAFAARGWLHHLPAAELSPQRLAGAIAIAAAAPVSVAAIASDGAAQTAAILRAALAVTMS